MDSNNISGDRLFVVTKNLGGAKEWGENVVTEKDKKTIASEVANEPSKYQFNSNEKSIISNNANIGVAAESFVNQKLYNCAADNKADYEIRKGDNYKQEVQSAKNELINKMTSDESLKKIAEFRATHSVKDTLSYKDLGITSFTIKDKIIDVSDLKVNKSLMDGIYDIILAKKYDEVQRVVTPELALIGRDSDVVYMFQEYYSNKANPIPNDITTIRPEGKAIAGRGNYAFHYAERENQKEIDSVIAIPKTFKEIKNKSFVIEDKTDVACVTAKRNNKHFMFISAHVSGFKKDVKENEVKEAALEGDKEIGIIAQKVKEFKKQHPGGIVVFGGDLNSSRELYAARHEALEEAGLNVQGSGKATNIQLADLKKASELDFIGVTTHKQAFSFFKKKIVQIAKFEIKKDMTPDQFEALKGTSDHQLVVGEITITKTQS